MMVSLTQLILIVLTPIWVFAVHCCIVRLPFAAKISPQRLTFLLVITVPAVLALLLALRTDFSFQHLLFTYIHSLLLAHIYFHFFNMSETARRIRILLNLHQGLDPKSGDYTPVQLTEIRITRLIENRRIQIKDDSYRTRPNIFLVVALTVSTLESFLFPSRDYTSQQ